MSLVIGPRVIDVDQPLFVVAELGLNHGGSIDRALALADAAAAAGASAVKLQTLTADRLVTAEAPPPAHVGTPSLREFFRQFEFDETAHRRLAERVRAHHLALLATPFDEDAVDLLVGLGCDALKIASGDLTHHGLIARAARTGLPLIVSTGMAELHEVHAALDVARGAGARQIALLHCVSAYPVPRGSENLGAIRELSRAFHLPVGLSDHGSDDLAVVVAVALGAVVYERHLVLDDEDEAVDRAVSSTPRALQERIALAVRARSVIGTGRRSCQPVEAANLVPSRRALYARRRLGPGDRITEDAVAALRPASGLGARAWTTLVGRRATRVIEEGAPFLPTDLGDDDDQRAQ